VWPWGGWRIEAFHRKVRPMQLTINGDAHSVPEGLTVRGLLEHLGMTEGPVAVERNRDVVPRAQHAAVLLSEGDQLEIVHFVGGG
jgi:sulfur carrier protein